MVDWLPHINVSLNALATSLLLVGFVLVKLGREQAHRNVMLATFAVSTIFLVSYLTYHFQVPSKKFPTDTSIAPLAARYFYYALLLSHIVLAITVPVLAVWAIWKGLAGDRVAHKRIVKWAWPIWLYVSTTGVIVYLMLYQIYKA